MLELAQENFEKQGKNKKSHIGYYLIDKGINKGYYHKFRIANEINKV